jgi:hypothetical protein
MESVRISSEVPVGHRLARFGLFVSRLMAFCLLYFAPVLAYVPDSPGSAPVPVQTVGDRVDGRVSDSSAAETLDPKHEKDHDEAREAEHGHGHFRAG